ncbi:MAG: Rpn family recombination-promoting nuclease/putative transposase [Xenococcaceae cyanobacterium]
MNSQPHSDYDSPWKEALDVYFEDFLAFFFPQAHREINWERGYETLDKELQQVVRDADLGKRLADKLVKVWLHDGEETLVLVHIEIQGQYDVNFAQRMFVYHYRIYDRYNTQVVSLAVLGDENSWWQPREYGYSRWGCELRLQFPVVKINDYQGRWQILEGDTNPFAVIVMAHLRTRETRDNPQTRLLPEIEFSPVTL